MKNYIFFQEFKTHFLVLTRVKFSNPNHIMQFNDTKTGKYFFQFFLQKITTHMHLLY